jgi:dethiobiotin synthetase
MSAYFVTATGTDIGKTFVAAGLIRHFRAAGRAVEAIKPVVTGFEPTSAVESDPGVLLSALGRPVTPVEIERIAPWRYAAPLSPEMAARGEGRALAFDALVEFCRRAIADRQDMLLIEGIGGVMVPLDDRRTVLDWMAALRIPLVLVAGSYLGSLSHTLTGLDAIVRRELVLKAIVVNETPDSTVPLADTVATLSRFAGATPVIAIPRQPATDAKLRALGELAALL